MEFENTISLKDLMQRHLDEFGTYLKLDESNEKRVRSWTVCLAVHAKTFSTMFYMR